jgi:hypothetical protein
MDTLIHQLPPDSKWAVDTYSIQADDGLIIAQAISNGCAIAVSDASLKVGFGTSANVLEGADPMGRIVAVNVVPGPISDGNSYCCELAGLIGILTMTNLLCQHHQLRNGSLRVACDNISSLYVFGPTFIPNPAKDSFDLVCCLQALIQACPITLRPEHVRGHQADKKARHFLSRLEQLNEEMDNLAKAYWHHKAEDPISPRPPSFSVANEGWSIWNQGNKLNGAQTDTLYPLIEDAHSLHHWTNSHTI